jgi:hypothetical protein
MVGLLPCGPRPVTDAVRSPTRFSHIAGEARGWRSERAAGGRDTKRTAPEAGVEAGFRAIPLSASPSS